MDAKKTQALAALIVSPTIRDAAASCGLDESTIRRYMRDASFKLSYDRALNELLQNASRTAHNALCGAITVLRDIAFNENEAAQIRVSAAKTLLDYALKLREATSIEERLSALEAK